MPIVTDASARDHLVVRATGKLVKEDYAGFVPAFEQAMKERGKLRVLFDTTELTGWDTGALWQEIKFDVKHFSDIERLAMVGAQKWQQTLEKIARPLTRAEMRYFDASEIDAARAWLVRP
jgi:hypothetical protein